MCILCICVRVLWAPRHVQDRGASGFPHADQLLAATYKACMFWINVPHTHTCQPSCPGAGMGLKKKSEYFWSTWMCVCVCVLAVWWCSVGRSLHTVAALNPQGTAHIHIQIPDTYPAWNTHKHTALFSIRSWLERKASKQLVKKKVHSSSRKSFAYFFFFVGLTALQMRGHYYVC